MLSHCSTMHAQTHALALIQNCASAAMNELTWRRVLEWEALHHDTCGDPKLLRFMGKPHDLRYIAACLVLPAQSLP